MAFTVGNVNASGTSSIGQALTGSITLTSTTTGTGNIPVMDCFSVADVHLNITAASGTSPLLDVYIQKLCPDGATWDDLIHFTQATSTADYLATVTVGNSGVHTIGTRALAAGTVRTTTMGKIWRIDCVVAGTTPSFTFQVFADFYV